MAQPDRRRRSRSGRLLDSLIWGALLGGASGAVLGDAIDGIGAAARRRDRRVLFAAAEAITACREGRRRAEAALAPHPRAAPC